jgi:hypothetical protein
MQWIPRNAQRVRGAIKAYTQFDPGADVARRVWEALGAAPLAIFNHWLHNLNSKRLLPVDSDPAAWAAIARACADNYRQYRTARLASEGKERLIALPFAERFSEPAALARYDLSLRRKASSAAQFAIVRDIIERSFAGDWAIWVKPGSAELAWATGYSREALALALWLAAVAGLVERHRIDGVWHYTAVPEAWDTLPDYDPPAAAPLETEAIA